jgi:hypothetical protein
MGYAVSTWAFHMPWRPCSQPPAALHPDLNAW